MRFRISPTLFFKEIDGLLVILDTRAEAYYIFDPVGTLMWKALLITDNEAEALDALRDKYAVAEGRLKADLEVFRDRCLEQGFLQEGQAEHRSMTPSCVVVALRKFLVLHAWRFLFQTTRSLSKGGLARVYQDCASLPVPKQGCQDLDDLLRRSVAAFARAENFFLIRSAPKDCLPRSLALFRFLRSVGLPVEHCIGVRQFPFQAHAWVEYQGRVVQDDPSRQLMFSTLARISA